MSFVRYRDLLNASRVGKKRLDYVSGFDIYGEVLIFINGDMQDLLIILGLEREFNETQLEVRKWSRRAGHQ